MKIDNRLEILVKEYNERTAMWNKVMSDINRAIADGVFDINDPENKKIMRELKSEEVQLERLEGLINELKNKSTD